VNTYKYEERLNHIDDQRLARIVRDICAEARARDEGYTQTIKKLTERVAQLESEREKERVGRSRLQEQYFGKGETK